jgi:hypothetical protein
VNTQTQKHINIRTQGNTTVGAAAVAAAAAIAAKALQHLSLLTTLLSPHPSHHSPLTTPLSFAQINLRRVYNWDPSPPWFSTAVARRIIGGEMCVWGEHVPSTEFYSWVFPRLFAGAERMWAPMASRVRRCSTHVVHDRRCVEQMSNVM